MEMLTLTTEEVHYLQKTQSDLVFSQGTSIEVEYGEICNLKSSQDTMKKLNCILNTKGPNKIDPKNHY